MHESAIIGLAIIVSLGILAQWLAWRFRIPSILLLLLFGFLAGPVTGLIHPDELFGDLLFPFVSVSVGIILFEGGLSLRFDEISGVQGVVRRLISIGALVTWAIIAVAAYFVLRLELPLAILLGAILVVTGPTVVIPLLRQIRPSGRVSSVLKWEGILIDPVGATLAVLVFDSIIEGGVEQQFTVLSIFTGVILTLGVGTIVGLLTGFILMQFLKRNWIATSLETVVALMAVLIAFAVSDYFRAESGLMAVTVMGILLANQKQARISHITSFKEDLGILLLSVLFVVLAARVNLEALLQILWPEAVFLAIIVLVARPLSVFASTAFSKIPRSEKLFMSAMAPRGIVAVAVASLFALELQEVGYEGAEQLVNITFFVVVGTVIIYSVIGRPLARALDLTVQQPQGNLIVGAHHWARQMATAIQEAGFDVWMVDTNGRHVDSAIGSGILAFQDSIMSDSIVDDLPLEKVGRLLALTDNGELNALSSLRFSKWLGDDSVFQLVPTQQGVAQPITEDLRGRILFGTEATFGDLEKEYYRGAQVLYLRDNAAESITQYQSLGLTYLVLFIVTQENTLLVSTANDPLTPEPGQGAIVMVEAVPIEQLIVAAAEAADAAAVE